MNKISDTKPEIRYGIFAGVGTIIFFSVMWLSFPRQAFGVATLYLSLVIYLICMFLAVKEVSDNSDEPLDFRQTAQKAFIVFLIANIFYYVYYYTLHSLNPEIAEYQRANSLETAKHFYPKDELRQQLQMIKEEDLTVTLGTVLNGYFLGVFPAFFWSLFIAFVNWLRIREN